MRFIVNIFSFLDRWEYKIFKKYNDNHQPVSAFVVTTVLCCAVAFALLLLVLQMAGSKAAEWVPVIPVACALLVAVWKMYRPLVAFSDMSVKFGYAGYILLVYAVSSALFITLSILAVIAFVVFLILKYFVPDMIKAGSIKSSYDPVLSREEKKEDVEAQHYEDGSISHYVGKSSGMTYDKNDSRLRTE